jgi:nucleotide-binding universal stress UspA family protein
MLELLSFRRIIFKIGKKMNKLQQLKSGSILLAVDGSLSAKAAAYAAAQIAYAMQWRLHALYVVDVNQVFELYSNSSPELGELGEDVPEEQKITLFEEQGTLALTEIEGVCQEMTIPVTTEMILGGIPNIILESAQQYNLLALGRRGNRHEKDTHHLGSNFRQIAHHTHIPLLIGGDYKTQQKFRRVLLAYDGGELSREALTWVEGLQTIFAEVMALSVEKEHEKDPAWLEERQREIAESALAHCKFIRREGEPEQVIASIASSRKADLIVMGAYQHAQLLEWATHSTIDSVLREIGFPILATK